MDLGALELQIFVSLVVVLGSAFVALVCDYLKGNNEQLRERNIELRVRTEERERFAILNPSAWLSQFRGRPSAVAESDPVERPVSAESVMRSHAPAEGLAQVAEREVELMSRVGRSEGDLAEAPPVAGFDVSARRRSRQKRGVEGEPGSEARGNSYDWVRPEVMARVARKAGRGQREAEEETAPSFVGGDLVGQPVPVPSMAADEESAGEESAGEERRAETVAQARFAGTPPVIMLRPLPAIKLAEELERVAGPVELEPATSQLLEEVIAASAAKPMAPVVVAAGPVVEPVVEAEAIAKAQVVEVVHEPEPLQGEEAESEAALPVLVAATPVVREEGEAPRASGPAVAPVVALEPSAGPVLEPVLEPVFVSSQYAGSALAEAVSAARQLDGEERSIPVPEEPVYAIPSAAAEAIVLPSSTGFPADTPYAAEAETPAYNWSSPEYAVTPGAAASYEPFEGGGYAAAPTQIPDFATGAMAPPDLTAVESASIAVGSKANELPELLLPAGMQDQATYRRLLEMPNPMSGIVISISINEFNQLKSATGEEALTTLMDSVEVLMGSMIRDSDFGVKAGADQWIFVYSIDENGFSQRRVAGLSEKLWDFQLRHLGQSNIIFSWAAVNVHDERFSDGVGAAVERMEASRRGGAKKSGGDRARLVANG